MEVNNILVEESLSYQYSGHPISRRQDEVMELEKVISYCHKLQERLQYSEALWDIEVEEECTLYDIIYGTKSTLSKDVSDMLREMLTKKCRQKKEGNSIIYCSCGDYNDAAANLQEYANLRQEYLRQCQNHNEFGKFMESCFPNSKFADGCEDELKYIKDFERYKEEIVKCLALLDKRAVELYKQYSNNLKEAGRILQAEMQRTCTLSDPNHKGELQFRFSYDEENVPVTKRIECQPHFKLIRDDSNLRVYFYWQDKNIEDGKKVLIGRVGRHPYRK